MVLLPRRHLEGAKTVSDLEDHAEERGIAPDPVCLVKKCDAEVVEIRAWGGQLMYRVHNHWQPSPLPSTAPAQRAR